MIYLTKGQPLFNNEGMIVCDPTGYYEDGSVVTCATFFAPDEPVCRYEAKYIAYGDQVYNISDEDKLFEEIKKIDPETLLGKTNADVTIDNLVQEIKTVDNLTPELTQDAVDTNNINVNNGDPATNTSIDNSSSNTTTETTTYDPVTDTTTTETTTITKGTTPEITEPTANSPIIETPIINTEVPIIPETIIPSSADQPVSRLNSLKKIG